MLIINSRQSSVNQHELEIWRNKEHESEYFIRILFKFIIETRLFTFYNNNINIENK